MSLTDQIRSNATIAGDAINESFSCTERKTRAELSASIDRQDIIIIVWRGNRLRNLIVWIRASQCLISDMWLMKFPHALGLESSSIILSGGNSSKSFAIMNVWPSSVRADKRTSQVWIFVDGSLTAEISSARCKKFITSGRNMHCTNRTILTCSARIENVIIYFNTSIWLYV
jgi:hypothetical protein